MHRLATFFALAAAAIVMVLSGPLTPRAASAQTSDTPSLDTPIGVPFIGSYEVWCTSRNPAPFNLCRSHHGTPAIDFGMTVGTPVRATGNGIVEEVETSCSGPGWCRNGAGNFISIAHADGRFSRYLHLTDVYVEAGDIISIGDLIGTSGETGQSSSPHLHYDEHFPRGTRSPMGEWLGCVDGEIVKYPDVFGETDWNLVPYGSIVRNDGYDCLTGVPPEPTAPPIVTPGVDQFAISAEGFTVFDLEITSEDGTTSLLTLNSGVLLRQPEPVGPVSIRLRDRLSNTLTWSVPVTYDPGVAPTGPFCDGLQASSGLIGTTAADVIIGTAGADRIDGRGGSDVICAGEGDDTIIGGRGMDWIDAGPGADIVSGGLGLDQIFGGDGDDSVTAGNGADRVFGGPGNDTLNGNFGNDHVEGGPGADTVIGGIGHDWLLGGPGDDRLEGRNGRDYLGGGLGDDQLFGNNGLDRLVGAGGDDSFDGGPKDDRCATDAEDRAPLVECER